MSVAQRYEAEQTAKVSFYDGLIARNNNHGPTNLLPSRNPSHKTTWIVRGRHADIMGAQGKVYRQLVGALDLSMEKGFMGIRLDRLSRSMENPGAVEVERLTQNGWEEVFANLESEYGIVQLLHLREDLGFKDLKAVFYRQDMGYQILRVDVEKQNYLSREKRAFLTLNPVPEIRSDLVDEELSRVATSSGEEPKFKGGYFSLSDLDVLKYKFIARGKVRAAQHFTGEGRNWLAAICEMGRDRYVLLLGEPKSPVNKFNVMITSLKEK